MKFIKKIIILLIFFSLATSLATGIYYLIFVIILSLFFLHVLIRQKIYKFDRVDYVALSFIGVWIYGIVLGFYKGNNPSYIIANFAGLMCYFLYFVLVNHRIAISSLSRIIIISGFIQCIYALTILVLFFVGLRFPSYFDAKIGFSSTGQFRIYFTNLAVIYPLLGISLYQFLYSNKEYTLLALNKKIIAFIIFLMSFSALFFLPSSKGFALGGIFVILTIFFFSYGSQLQRYKLHISFFIFVFIVLILIFVLFRFNYINIITDMFNSEDISNVERYEQLNFMLADVKFMGQGLGAVVPGYISSGDAPYGFELTFINTIHKFGLLSFILFTNWIYIFLFLLKRCWMRKNIVDNIIMLSSLGYLFPAIGNPVLFHPSLVMLNAIVLYHIKNEKINEKRVSLHGNL